MAKVDTLQLWRLRLSDLPRRPGLLALLLVGDLVELGLSVALAAISPVAPARGHAAYPTVDVPYTPPPVTTGVALVGVALGVWMGMMLVAELVVMIRRAQILRYRSRVSRRGVDRRAR